MTDIDVYQPAAPGQYQAGIVMDEKAAKALDDQVRRCTEAVLRENTDYGVIPGTNGQKTLWRPGAQKLLQWFGLSCTCERVEIERDDDGRKHGITYRATVTRRLPDGTPWILATCEGTADYDESKFYQTAEEVQRKAKDRETRNAETYRRPRNPEKWQGLGEYRADWNALMKRAQKRAIVGAVVDATAAGGIFTDREEDDHAPPPADDGPSWYEQAIEYALTFKEIETGRGLYVETAKAHRDGLINRRQQDHLQNTIKKRVKLLETATPVDVEDLAKAAQDSPQTARGKAAAGNGAPAPDPAGTGQPAPPPPGEDEDHGTFVVEVPAAGQENPPARATSGQLSMLGQRLGKLGVDDENRLGTLERLAGHELSEPAELTQDEAAHIRGLLDRCKGDRGALVELLATGQLPQAEKAGDGDE